MRPEKAMVQDLEGDGTSGKGGSSQPQRGNPRPLQDDGRADDQAAVVCKNGKWQKPLPSRLLKNRERNFIPDRFEQDVSALAGEHPRLVHLKTALVGTSDSGLHLRGVWRDHGCSPECRKMPEMRLHHFTRTRIPWIPGSPPRCGPSPLLAGRRRQRSLNTSIPLTYS